MFLQPNAAFVSTTEEMNYGFYLTIKQAHDFCFGENLNLTCSACIVTKGAFRCISHFLPDVLEEILFLKR